MKKRGKLQPFSIAFLDCICCGFGAVLLLFVLTSGKKSESDQRQLSEVQLEIGELSREVDQEKEMLQNLREMFQENQKILTQLELEQQSLTEEKLERDNQLQLVMSRRSEMEETLAQMLGELEELPTADDEVPIPTANPIRRQYLTDFKMEGERVLFILDASGSMTDFSVPEAIAWSGKADDEVRENAPKWNSVVRAMEWLLTTFRPPTKYQVLYFNTEARILSENDELEWRSLSDRLQLADTVEHIRNIRPRGGSNMERAFRMMHRLDPLPDNIVLITDGFPSQSDRMGALPEVTEDARREMFNHAIGHLPRGIPVNILLYPWVGDPHAPAYFWRLANYTNGSYIVPHHTWPDT